MSCLAYKGAISDSGVVCLINLFVNIAVMLCFDPSVPFVLPKDIWIVVDIVCAVLMFALASINFVSAMKENK